MSPRSRRAFLRDLAGVGVSVLGAGCAGGHVLARPVPSARPSPLPPDPGARPRYFVLLYLTGGYDSVLSFHGLDQGAVGASIDCGYPAADRRRGARRFYGPCIGGLLRHEADLALVHGVRTDTVSHQDGDVMVAAGKRYATGATFTGRLSARLPGAAPLSTAVFLPERPYGARLAEDDALVFDAFTLATVGRPEARRHGPRWVARMRELQRAQARTLDGPQADQYVAELERAELVERWLGLTEASPPMTEPNIGPALQMTLTGLRHDLAKCFVTATKRDWFDTHSDHERNQRSRLTPTLDDVATFLDALKRERNEHGTLFDQTLVLLGSELGRYPKLNAVRGKDHWPENTWVLVGGGVAGGTTVGETGADFRALPVNFASGATGGPASRPLYIDSVFATAARILVGDAGPVGYKSSDVLDCLVG